MRAMKKTAILACLPVVLFLGVCRKQEPAQTKSGSPAVALPPVPPPPAPPPGLGSPEVTELLTEDKLKRFLTYQKEAVAATLDATAPGTAALQKSGTEPKPPGDGAAKDERAAKLAAVLKTSGLSQDEVAKLSRLLVPYYARIAGIQETMKRSEAARLRLEEAKRAGQEPNSVDQAVAKTLGDQSKRIEAVRAEFASRYGEARVALLQKHEADFLPVHLKMMSAAMGGMGMRRPPLPPPGSGPPPTR